MDLNKVIKIKGNGDWYLSIKLNSSGEEAITDDGIKRPTSNIKATDETKNKKSLFLSASINGVKK
jgi:hypothetical protein